MQYCGESVYQIRFNGWENTICGRFLHGPQNATWKTCPVVAWTRKRYKEKDTSKVYIVMRGCKNADHTMAPTLFKCHRKTILLVSLNIFVVSQSVHAIFSGLCDVSKCIHEMLLSPDRISVIRIIDCTCRGWTTYLLYSGPIIGIRNQESFIRGNLQYMQFTKRIHTVQGNMKQYSLMWPGDFH